MNRITEVVDINLDDESALVPPDEIAEDGAAGGVPLARRFFNLKTAASFAVAFVIMFFAFSRINVDPATVIAHIREANVGIFLLALFVYYLSFPVRALRWQMLLGNVGYYRRDRRTLPSLAGLAEIIFLSWFANCIVPAKLGDAYRGYLLKRNGNVSFSRTMGTILAERVVDTLMLLLLMGLSGLVMFKGYLPDTVRYLFGVSLMLAVLIVGALVSMKRFGRQLERLLPARFRGFYARFEEGTLRSFRDLPVLFALSAVVWGFEAARLWLVVWALGLLSFGPLVVIFVSLASSLLTTLPITPAGLGLVESGVIGILVLLNSAGIVDGVTENIAGSVAILDRVISYWSLVVIGVVVYIFTRKK